MTTAHERTKFEHAEPILRVSDMAATVRYYTDVLGFVNAEWAPTISPSCHVTELGFICAEALRDNLEHGLGSEWRT